MVEPKDEGSTQQYAEIAAGQGTRDAREENPRDVELASYVRGRIGRKREADDGRHLTPYALCAVGSHTRDRRLRAGRRSPSSVGLGL